MGAEPGSLLSSHAAGWHEGGLGDQLSSSGLPGPHHHCLLEECGPWVRGVQGTTADSVIFKREAALSILE